MRALVTNSGFWVSDRSEAPKNLSDWLKRAYHQLESYELVKNGVAYAHFLPANRASFNTHELADDVEKAELSAEDRRTLASAVRKARKILKPLKKPRA